MFDSGQKEMLLSCEGSRVAKTVRSEREIAETWKKTSALTNFPIAIGLNLQAESCVALQGDKHPGVSPKSHWQRDRGN